jgi:hypothetical protein
MRWVRVGFRKTDGGALLLLSARSGLSWCFGDGQNYEDVWYRTQVVVRVGARSRVALLCGALTGKSRLFIQHRRSRCM